MHFNPEDLSAIAEWVFKSLGSMILIYGVKIFTQVRNSIQELNKNMAVMLERSVWQEKSLEHLDKRVTTIERRKK